MKVTVVPAQITTVEDRIVGSLGLSQLLLLCIPIFGGSLLYVILPPNFHAAIYKIVIITLLAAMCGLAAVRVKGKILLLWLVVILRYNARPRFYVFNKRSPHGRELYDRKIEVEVTEEQKPATQAVKKKLSLTTAELSKVYGLLENPAANVHFEIKKGGLYVHATEVKPES